MLFADSRWVGTFKGFTERGLEFAAEIVAPYDASMLERPQLGQFLLVELGSPDEAALGRITRFVPTGLLTTPEGEDYVNTMQRRGQQVPEDLKQQRLKYRVQIKLLGAVRANGKSIVYVPSQRRLPHLGARVALPSDAVLAELCKLSGGKTELGTYVLGEFNYCGAHVKQDNPALRSLDPKLPVYFDVTRLVSRRSFVFARAGYGKSNLIKYLVSELYQEPPTVQGRPVGTLIFDADGEYFWPDAKGRPGLCDVPHLKDHLVVFTNRKPRNPYYASWTAGNVRLDLTLLPAYDVISIAVAPDRQTHQNVIKLKQLSRDNWRQMVNLIHEKGLNASDEEVGKLLGYDSDPIQRNSAEIAAAKSNMLGVVRSLHDPNSTLLRGTLQALREGRIVVIDISLLNSKAGEMLAGLVLRRIFSYNQENFTSGESIIPVVAVIEEAQSVLGKRLDDTSPFVEWVKEGRKYELGAIMVTQQPGSLAPELLSQGDNWFAFHLLSESDARTLHHHNAHYSEDILAHLIGEPIQGNCYMWSAPNQPFVLPVRITNFETLYSSNVQTSPDAAGIATYAADLRKQLSGELADVVEKVRERLKTEGFYELVKEDGSRVLGVKEGRIYYLLMDSLPDGDSAYANKIKEPVLRELLPGGMVDYVKEGKTAYFAAPASAWREALGTEPQVKPRE